MRRDRSRGSQIETSRFPLGSSSRRQIQLDDRVRRIPPDACGGYHIPGTCTHRGTRPVLPSTYSGRPLLNFLLWPPGGAPNGNLEVSICDPRDRSRRILIPSRPRKVQVGSFKILSCTLSHQSSSLAPPPSATSSIPTFPRSPAATALAYKKVARKVRPVTANLPKDFRNIRRILEDPSSHFLPSPPRPLTSLPVLASPRNGWMTWNLISPDFSGLRN